MKLFLNPNFGKTFILIGVGFIILGLGVIVFSHFKVNFLGRLPGDILIKRDNFTFYFPVTTSLVISLVVTLILYLISKK